MQPRFIALLAAVFGVCAPVGAHEGHISIATEPVSQSVLAYQNASFFVEGYSSLPLSYQWFFNEVTLPGATNSALSLTNVRHADAGGYSVVLSNSVGAVTSAVARLHVRPLLCDVDHDGVSEVLWQNTNGAVALWFMNQTNVEQGLLLRGVTPGANGWRIAAQGDLNHDGQTDVIWMHTNRTLAAWLMQGTNYSTATLREGHPVAKDWSLIGLHDFDSDDETDILWQHSSGLLGVWYMQGTNMLRASVLNHLAAVQSGWRIMGLADFDADGEVDFLWQKADGALAAWFMQGTNLLNQVPVRSAPSQPDGWRVVGLQDLNMDGKVDFLWQKENGRVAVWLMNGLDLIASIPLREGQPVSPGWFVGGFDHEFRLDTVLPTTGSGTSSSGSSSSSATFVTVIQVFPPRAGDRRISTGFMEEELAVGHASDE